MNINLNGATVKSLYEKLTSERKPYIDRALKCAKLTIPALFFKAEATGQEAIKTPNQSVGAVGVNNLSSKLMLALFPPNTAFFRLGLTPEAQATLEAQSASEKQSEMDNALMGMEHTIMRFIESNQIRVSIFEGLKHLLVAGNALLYLPPKEGGIKLYNLKNYVIQRDALGNVMTIITQEHIAKGALPEDVQHMVDEKIKPEESVTVYTYVTRIGDTYESVQELEGEFIAGTEQSFPLYKTPYIPLRMVKQDGESYGRSYVEEYLGDLVSLDKHQKAVDLTIAISTSVFFMVNPNGTTRPKVLQKAKSGDFVSGRVEDIGVLQTQKYPDISIAQQHMKELERRLSYAFLLSSVVQRQGERVTAEEIRTVAGLLEDNLGGVYSLLSQELQLPLIRRILAQLMSQNALPQLSDGVIEPTITTGMEALGRGHDLNKYATFLQMIGQMPTALERINWSKVLIDVATSLGIETQGLVKTEEQLQQERMQQQMMEQGIQQGMIPSEGGEM